MSCVLSSYAGLATSIGRAAEATTPPGSRPPEVRLPLLSGAKPAIDREVHDDEWAGGTRVERFGRGSELAPQEAAASRFSSAPREPGLPTEVYEMLRVLSTIASVLAVQALLASAHAQAEAAPDPAINVEPFRVPLLVAEDEGVARIAEPVSGGIPLPRGAVRDPAELVVLDPAGSPVPCQAHQLGIGWPDGSLKWVLIQFQASVAPKEVARYALGTRAVGSAAAGVADPPAPPPLRVSDEGTAGRPT